MKASHTIVAAKLEDATSATIRPIEPSDEHAIVRFHQTLSDETVYYRYLRPFRLSQRIAHRRLARICRNDGGQEVAFVAEAPNLETRRTEIVAVGRLIKFSDSTEAEFALVVTDLHQGTGLGTRLLRQIIETARAEGRRSLIGYALPENAPMLHICNKLGFRTTRPSNCPVVKAELDLFGDSPPTTTPEE